jgi:ABC-type amino acid transport substrate-binding protein
MSSKGNKKEIIKVFVLTGPETNGIVAHKYTKEDGTTDYRGFSLDLFRQAIEHGHLNDKFIFEIVYMKDAGKINYQEIVESVAAGKYDIAIGGFINTPVREKLVDFTVPTKIDSTSLYYVPDKSSHDIEMETLKDIARLIAIAIGVGLIVGTLLFYFNPKRKGLHEKLTKKGFFYRTIMTTIASMFGEMGYLSENSTPNLKGVVIAIIIMVLAFLFGIFIQAKLTTSMIEERINRNLSSYSITRGTILGHEGYALAKRFEELGGNVEFIKHVNNDQLIDMYLKNQDKYIGVALSYCDGYPYLQIHPQLATSLHGNHTSGFPVNQSKHKFLDQLNIAIMHMSEDNSLSALCKAYFGKVETENTPTCTLT